MSFVFDWRELFTVFAESTVPLYMTCFTTLKTNNIRTDWPIVPVLPLVCLLLLSVALAPVSTGCVNCLILYFLLNSSLVNVLVYHKNCTNLLCPALAFMYLLVPMSWV